MKGTQQVRTRIIFLLTLGVLLILAVLSTQITVFVVQPIGAVPEGRPDSLEIVVEEAELNVPLDDARFEMPG